MHTKHRTVNLKGRDRLVYTSVDNMITLKWILVDRLWGFELNWEGQDKIQWWAWWIFGFPAKDREFLHQLSYYHLLFIPLSLRTKHRASKVPRHPRLLFQFLGSIRHLVGLLGGGISPAQGLYLHRTTQHRKTQTNIHAPSRIRTCDPNIWAAEDSTCPRPLGHWDRRF
jgi:hypothetical protein